MLNCDSVHVDNLVEFLAERVVPPHPEANETHGDGGGDLEPLVPPDQRLELVREGDVLSDIVPEPLLPVQTEDEPHLEGAEAAAEGDVPVPVVGDGTLVA